MKRRLDPKTLGVARHLVRGGATRLSDILLRADTPAEVAEAVRILESENLVTVRGPSAEDAAGVLEDAEKVGPEEVEALQAISLRADDIEIEPMKDLFDADLSDFGF